MLQRLRQLQNQNMDMARDKPLYSDNELQKIQWACQHTGVILDDDVLTQSYAKNDIMAFVRGQEICSQCKGITECSADITGYTPLIDNKGHLVFCQCVAKARQQVAFNIERNRKQADIPKLYQTMTFDTLEIGGNSNTVAMAQKLAHGDSSKGLYLFGDPGVGKTHIAIATLQVYLDRGSGLFYTMPQLAGQLRSLVKDDEALSALIDKAKTVGLLVIDDMGAEKWTEYIGERMFELLNDRYVNQRLTIITSNLSLDDLADKMTDQGPRLASRIKGMCDVRLVTGYDRRLID